LAQAALPAYLVAALTVLETPALLLLSTHTLLSAAEAEDVVLSIYLILVAQEEAATMVLAVQEHPGKATQAV